MGVRKIILFANIILISSSHNKKKTFLHHRNTK